jgi:signal transduction histidine kinase
LNKLNELDYLEVSKIMTQKGSLKKNLSGLFQLARKDLVYDNLVLLGSSGSQENDLEVIIAIATGRGKSKGEEVFWDGDLAQRVLISGKPEIYTPKLKSGQDERLNRPEMLGMPVYFEQKIIGVLVLIRFGGPCFDEASQKITSFLSNIVSAMLVRNSLIESIDHYSNEIKSLKYQDDILAVFSHELKTPLGFIKGYATTLLREDTEWDKETVRDFLQIITDESDNLTAMIENVLDSARIKSEALTMNFLITRLDLLLLHFVANAKLKSNNPDIKTTIKVKAEAFLDEKRIIQVLANLLANARKYAPGSRIEIQLSEIKDHNRIHFRDFGPGIPEKYLSSVFHRFFQVPEIETNGFGLGLYICNNIISLHNGRFLIRSKVNYGTTFMIDIPKRPSSEKARQV